MEVKGTWIVDYVKLIHAFKDKNWDKYLEAADWDIVRSKVLPSGWYPYDSFNRIGRAVFCEVAGQNLDIAKGFGKSFADSILQIYKNLVVPGDPGATIGKIYALQGTFFRDIPSMISPTAHEPNRSVVRINVSERELRLGAVEAFSYQFAGMMERLAELAGAKTFKTRVGKTGSGYEIEITWT